MPRKKIGQHFFVRMTQMRRTVDVIDRGGEKIGTSHAATLLIGAFLARGMLNPEMIPEKMAQAAAFAGGSSMARVSTGSGTSLSILRKRFIAGESTRPAL